MFPRVSLAAVLSVVGCSFVGYCLVGGGRAEEPRAESKVSVVAGEAVLDWDAGKAAALKKYPEWKKKYVFRSLEERLQYEAPARNGSAPSLSDEAAKRLDDADAYVAGSGSFVSARAESLQMLHTMEVNEFVARSGFGLGRALRPGPTYIDLVRTPLEEFPKLAPPSAEESNLLPTTLLREDRGAAGELTAQTRLLPTRREMHAMLDHSVSYFAGPWSFGWVKSRREAAGFEAHAFIRQPWTPSDFAQWPDGVEPKQPTPDERFWKLTRLELVSLLKHETPCVYESEQLPTMEELSSANAKTRPLAKFETAALEKLRGGEDIHTSSTPNRIEMLGAIRASKQCLQCHEVPRGTLLGAFSYELRRDPPIAVTPAAANVQ